MRKVWEILPRLCRAVRDDHAKYGMENTGHNFDHALRCGQYALLIDDNPETARLAGAAGICHNADRILQHILGVGRKDVPWKDVEEMVRGWFSVESFGESDTLLILDAIKKHSGKNSPEDSPVLMVLMDADRLTCSDAGDIMESVRFFGDLPILDRVHFLDDPAATFREPRSVFRILSERFPWGEEGGPVGVRLPKAKELMRSRLEVFRIYIDAVISHRKEIGLVPYPFES